ncbi:hypothetical protein Y695_04663 [Hydrogenophaga sp. T4]|nr:hypothetical protein Y695_04663 [Hydrogenophaga sp. T4]
MGQHDALCLGAGGAVKQAHLKAFGLRYPDGKLHTALPVLLVQVRTQRRGELSRLMFSWTQASTTTPPVAAA